MIQFTVPGNPVPKGRPRSFVRGGKVGHYTPKKTADYEKAVRMLAEAAMMGRNPICGAVAVEITATFAIPPSWAKKRKEAAKNAPHTSKPDLDNCIKAICDGCNGVTWADDDQIYRISAIKRYGDVPGVEVKIVEMA